MIHILRYNNEQNIVIVTPTTNDIALAIYPTGYDDKIGHTLDSIKRWLEQFGPIKHTVIAETVAEEEHLQSLWDTHIGPIT